MEIHELVPLNKCNACGKWAIGAIYKERDLLEDKFNNIRYFCDDILCDSDNEDILTRKMLYKTSTLIKCEELDVKEFTLEDYRDFHKQQRPQSESQGK